MPFALLAQLWLAPPTATTAARGRVLLDLPAYGLDELATAYHVVFTPNVQPLASVFTGATGEAGAAPDHLGEGLGQLDEHARRAALDDFAGACAALLHWAPAACMAVEREPGAHIFYRALAFYTAETLLLNAAHLRGRWAGADLPPAAAGPGFLAVPARCGLYLSLGRLAQWARAWGLPAPAGTRQAAVLALFDGARAAGSVARLVEAVEVEVAAWSQHYRRWAEDFGDWQPAAEAWQVRLDHTLRWLEGWRATL